MIKAMIIAGCGFGAFIALSSSPPVDIHKPLQPIQLPAVAPSWPQPPPAWSTLPDDGMDNPPVNAPHTEPTSDACAPGIINCGVLHT
jgi:hypothetical protein